MHQHIDNGQFYGVALDSQWKSMDLTSSVKFLDDLETIVIIFEKDRLLIAFVKELEEEISTTKN